MCACACARPFSLTKSLPPPLQPGSCSWFSPFLRCIDHICVLICLGLYIYSHVINVEIYVYSDVKQAVNWQVFKRDKIRKWICKLQQVRPSSRLLECIRLQFPVYHSDSTFTQRLQLWHSVRVWSSLHLLAHARCAQCSPKNPLWLASQDFALIVDIYHFHYTSAHAHI